MNTLERIHRCPMIACLLQAPFHLKKLRSRLPRYLIHQYHRQPLNIIGVRHRNITQHWIQSTYLLQVPFYLKNLQSRRRQYLTHRCPTIAYLAQAQYYLKMLRSRLPRYLTRLYRSQPLNIIGVRHRNITQHWIQ
ncbi:uncharacterized protein LOC135391337 [Ornithodoros turicata]|uniref:uncharacterized protein LOC135391337 n=1 Tax=Ornithodoros turicata TaxID=34597 RepID=UPI003139B610